MRIIGGGQRWREMSSRRRTLTVVLGVVQVSLAVAAWVDLKRRPASQIRGPKQRWAAVISVNFVGPLFYFARGRITAPAE
jgi:hypothetical protein